ncbi:hypothetical protein GCM10008933_09790 [Paenibacillus motobuensis]|uniref:Uncharacterized protein n=1 Tax=Paenibacillus motobuensis TaxID=295324 RepID=A0ABN0Y309_9BACL
MISMFGVPYLCSLLLQGKKIPLQVERHFIIADNGYQLIIQFTIGKGVAINDFE